MLQTFTFDQILGNERMTLSRNAQNFTFFGIELESPTFRPFLYFVSSANKETPTLGEVTDEGRSFM